MKKTVIEYLVNEKHIKREEAIIIVDVALSTIYDDLINEIQEKYF